MAKAIAKAKQVDFDELFTNLFLTGKEQELEINRIKLRIDLMRLPKGIGIGVAKQHGDHQGFGSGTPSVEEAISLMRSMYLSIAKEDLPEVSLPPVRTWYVYVRRGGYYPFYEGRYKPNMDDYLISDPQSGYEDEYFFDIPIHVAPELDFPREGNTVYIPKHAVWSITDYFQTYRVNHEYYLRP